jgi:hypothetical protein
VRAKGTRKRKAEGSDSGPMSARALLERIGQEEEKDEPRLTAREQAYVERAKAAQEMQERAFDRPTLTQAQMMLASLRGAGPLMVKRFREGGDVIEEDELAAFNRMLKKQDDDARTDRYFQELNEAMAETIRDFRFGRAQAEDVQRFFPGHSEWDIHRRFGDTDEETNLTFPSGPPSFKRLEEFEPAPHQEIDDFGPEGRYRREKVLGARRGGEVSTEDFIRKRQAGSPEEGEVIDPNEEMASGFAGGREPGKAEELFRALVEGSQGFLGLEPGRRGSEAYRTGQALSNLPALALPAAAVKGTGKAKDALKALGKKETPVVNPARVFEEVDKLPTNQYIDEVRSAHIGGVGDFGDSDAKYFFDRVPGGKQYIKRSQQVAKKNLGNQFMGYRLMSRDEFEALQAGDVGELLSFSLDRNAAEAFRNFVKNQNRTDLVVAQVPLTPKHVVAFGSPGEKEIIVDTAQGWSMDDFKLADPVKKAQGGEVSTTDFIRKREKGSPPDGEVPTDDYIQQMMTGTPPSDKSTFNIGKLLTQYGISPADAAAFLGRAGAGVSLAMQPSEAKSMTMDEYLAMKQAPLDFGGAVPSETNAARAMLQAIKSRNPAQGAQAAQEMMRVYSGYGDEVKGRFDVSKTDPRSDMGRALYASTSPAVASESAVGRLAAKGIMPEASAVYPLDIPKQSILFLEQEYPSALALKLKKFANKTPIPEGPTVTGEDLYESIRKLPKEKQGEAVRLLGFKGAQFLPGGKALSTGNFAIFNTDGTVSAITGKQFQEGGEVTRFIKAHA